MVVPVVVVAVATYLLFARIGLSDSYPGLIIVHAALGAPIVLTTVMATLQNFNQNLVLYRATNKMRRPRQSR